ncbi:hypothetical protein WMY93_011420 [Mugilogobius chulae]|uniref:DDE Tnp4 domain-containing protein n=1 Tax=Mugilogobius chulae TaxID=88201 RepID=A0AAW0PCK7_9GOBI
MLFIHHQASSLWGGDTPISLITLYSEPLQGPVEARFNARHAKACIVIERVFGMMKARWRGIFFKALEVNTNFVPKVVAVCTILHNLAVTNRDILEAAEEDPLPPPDPPHPEQDNEEGGQALRANLAAPRECLLIYKSMIMSDAPQ